MLDSLKTLWNRLTMVQRISLCGVMAVVFGGILFMVNGQAQGSYGVLFSNMEAGDAGEVVEKLKEMKVAYRLQQGGRTVEVPEDQVLDLRLALTSEGLPHEGVVGFELFDKNQFGATEFTQHLNRMRALQGELVRTIKRLEGVKEARVHIAIPEQRLFQQDQNPATASVVVHLRPGYTMPQKQVAGIVHLTASAVEGLKPENVSVHDALGELLSGDNDGINLTTTQIQVQEQYEKRLATQLTQLAQEVLGPGKAAIKVHAEFNWDETETSRETFQGAGPNGKGLPIEETSNSESYTRSDAQQAAGGVPGTPTTMAGAVAAVAGAATGAGTKPGDYSNTRTTNRYALNRVVEKRTTAPGRIQRISVAVLLDSETNGPQQQALKNAFAAAAGLDLAEGGRGDKIELLPMAFDRTAEQKEEEALKLAAKQEASQSQLRTYAAAGIVGLIAILSLILTLRLKGPRRKPQLDTTIGDPLPATYGPKTAAVPEEALVGAAAATAGSSSAGMTEPETAFSAPAAEELRLPPLELVQRLAAEKPEEVARQLELWMAENA